MRGFGEKNQVELIGKVEIRAKFVAVGDACMAIF